eukprot:4766213-Pyramimonas_sp.AAC.1
MSGVTDGVESEVSRDVPSAVGGNAGNEARGLVRSKRRVRRCDWGEASSPVPMSLPNLLKH